MADEQFNSFMEKANAFFRLQEEKFITKDEFRQEMSNLHTKIDHIIDMTDTDERERLALSANFDREIDNHARRIATLELAHNS